METTLTRLRADVVEQVMRVADDELSLIPFLDAPPASPAAMAALGRLLSDVQFTLTEGSPLVALCTGGELDASWRKTCETRPGSLWQSFEMLQSLYGPASELAADPYEGFCELRARSEEDLASP